MDYYNDFYIQGTDKWVNNESDMTTNNVKREVIHVYKNPESLVIKEHDFKAAKDSIKKFAEQAKIDVELGKVPSDGGLFKLGDHKVTGSELNRITSQIQGYLIQNNTLTQSLVNEFGVVYNAFEFLDKDYISYLVDTVEGLKEVSKQEQKDREDIKNLIAQQEIAISVLEQFKEDLENLKHLSDIDKVWEILEKHAGIFKNLEKDISKISVEQKEMFKELKENQSLTFEQIANEQSDKLNQIYQSLEDEKSNLNEKVNVLTQKVKSMSILAGGAVALTIIQLFLNILGVI